MRVILTRRAERDFEAQVRWLQQHSPAAGRAAALRIVEILDLLSHFPDTGMVVHGTTREKYVRFGRDGFVIRYRRSGDSLRVHRIFHSRQDRRASIAG
jgi:plasmid stabilization system protein ParE